jgi:hypothetical protein
MTIVFASSFMEAALATMIIPIAVYLSLIAWYVRASKRYRMPVRSMRKDSGPGAEAPVAIAADHPEPTP